MQVDGIPDSTGKHYSDSGVEAGSRQLDLGNGLEVGFYPARSHYCGSGFDFLPRAR